MLELRRLLKEKKISYKDISIYYWISIYNLKTAKELSYLTGSNYSRLTESLNNLLKWDLIIKTKDYPTKYFIENGKDK